MDPQTAIVIDNLIRDLTQEYKTTTVVISHDMNSVIEIGDNIHFLHEGTVAWRGDRKGILDSGVKELDTFVYASDLMRKHQRQTAGPLMSEKTPHIPYSLPRQSSDEMRQRLDAMYEHLVRQAQRSHVQSDPIPLDVLERAVQIAGTAPSGAHKQPWSFCIVTDPELRARIRVAVEEEELRSYSERMSDRWLQDLAPLATDHIKPFIEEAPALIIGLPQGL